MTTWPRSASPTSARPPSCGTATPASRSTTRSSGRTRAPTSSCDELSADGGQDRFRTKVGLPLATYFSGPKVRWILDNVDGARAKAEAGDLVFGNIDTWCIWNLTGGVNGGLHITDVTNASRTMLMDLETLAWDEEIASTIGVPMSMLPEIHASSEVYGEVRTGNLAGVPVAGDLGDQQAATFGQACFDAGEAKNTYGTGNFMLLNTGTEAVQSKSGLLTTVCYKIGDEAAVYCAGGLDRDHRRARAVAARQPAHDSGRAAGGGAGQVGRRQRGAATSCPRSRACSPRTGSQTPAACSPA